MMLFRNFVIVMVKLNASSVDIYFCQLINFRGKRLVAIKQRYL